MPEPTYQHVYIFQSISHKDRYYTGTTANLKDRLARHNSSGVPHMAKYVPWRLRTEIAFSDKPRALAFKKYLKTPSGRAFA
jgi:predicted GIY-YIG superfamily endonuclease